MAELENSGIEIEPKAAQPGGLKRTVLFQTEKFEVVAIRWTEGSVSPRHNHGWSQCHVLIQAGEFENTLYAGMKTETRRLVPGDVLSSPVGSAHALRCLSTDGSTLHVYVPRIEPFLPDKRRFSFEPESAGDISIKLGEPVAFDDLEKTLHEIIRNSVSTHSPYFMNQLFSGVHPQTLLADQLISRSRTTLATREASPVFSRLEAHIVDRLGELVGFAPESREGIGVPGGSAANFMALHLARHRQWPQVKTTGLSGVRASVFVSESAHYSLLKAAAALGLGTDAVVKVATDHEGRMDPRDLETQIDRAIDLGSTPLLVCATAGTTVFGAFDPLTEIAEVTSAHKIWLHVDCAWGGPALFSKRLRGLVRGIDQADSLTFDAHKLFGASLVCSFIVTKHKGLLVRANDVSGADYLFHDPNESVDRGRMSWQCGRGPDALSFWAIWKSLGTEGLGDFVDRLLFERDRALEWISRQPRLELIHQPDFLNVCVRIHPPSGSNDINWSIKVREALIRDQVAMVNFSQDADGPFLRLILAHPEISSTHIIEILGQALLVRGADQPCEL